MNRRRLARAVAAAVIGFVVATGAFSAVRDEPDEPTRVEVGSIGVFEYCREQHGRGAAAIILGENAWSWNCAYSSNNVFRQSAVDFDLACNQQHGVGAYASPLDNEDPNSWRCFVDE